MAGIKTTEVISVDDFPQISNNQEHFGARTSENGYFRGKFTSRVAKFTAGEDLVAGDRVFFNLGNYFDSQNYTSTATSFSRATYGGTWSTSGTILPLVLTSGGTFTSAEYGFSPTEKFKGGKLKSVSFLYSLSGGSGGTNYGNFTFRIYKLDSITGLPTTELGSVSKVVNTWAHRDIYQTATFSVPLDVNEEDIVISVQYDTTDSDDLTVTNLVFNYSLVNGKILLSDSVDSKRKSIDGIVTADATSGSDVWVDVSEALEGIPTVSGLTAGNLYYLQSDKTLGTTETDVLVGIAYNSNSIIRKNKDKEIELVLTGTSASVVSYTATETGIIQGSGRGTSSGSSIRITITVSGNTYSYNSEDGGYASVCVFVRKGDVISLDGSNKNYNIYFQPLNI